jgi:cytochrome c-type biogenesis protein CcmH
MGLRRLVHCLLLAWSVVGASSALAVQPDEVMRDPVQEQRARALSRELRCMVCQNQSIDDSDAPLARDLRLLVRERIGAGDSDVQVIDFLVARYGAFVLLKPRFEAQTFALWLLPPLALGAGALLLLLAARRRRAGGTGARDAALVPLSPEEQARLAELLGNKDFSPPSGPGDHPGNPGITKV